MARKTDKYAEYVEHPRYGRAPRLTGWNPEPFERGITLDWRMRGRVPNTAIAADVARQAPATIAVTHYFDVKRKCRDCDRPFIFFAVEQKFWYETLGFGLDSDCVRCVECRKRQQGIARDRETYETLFHVENKSVEELLHMADACLALVEAKVFTAMQTERVRMLLNKVPSDADVRKRSRFADLMTRVMAAENEEDSQAKA